MIKLRNRLPLVALCLTLAPLLPAGCGGGSGSSSVVIESFSNGFADLADQNDRNATLSLRVRGNQRVEGTLTIVTDGANQTRATTNFVFPTGSFVVSGDYTPFNSNSAFTAQGTFSTPSVQFTIKGTFPTGNEASSFTISGTYNGVVFSEVGTIPARNAD